MAFKVTWSAIALEDYILIIEYLLREWSLSVVEDFTRKVDARVEMISWQPFSGRESEQDKSVRSVLIKPHSKLYYQIFDEQIEILSIFDTRQNPSKNKFD